MQYNVRGGIGTQIMQFLAAYSTNWTYENKKISEIVLNWGNYPNWMYNKEQQGNHLVDVNYIARVFHPDTLPTISNTIGTGKTNFFDMQTAEHMIKNRDRLIRSFPIFAPLSRGYGYKLPHQEKMYKNINKSLIMHTRTKDRQTLTLEQYIFIWKYNSVFNDVKSQTMRWSKDETAPDYHANKKYIIGDNEDFMRKIMSENYEHSYMSKDSKKTFDGKVSRVGNDPNSPDKDFLTIAHGKENVVFSGFTTFTLAAAFLNEDSFFKIVRGKDKFAGGINNIDWEVMDYFESTMSNLKYLDISI